MPSEKTPKDSEYLNLALYLYESLRLQYHIVLIMRKLYSFNKHFIIRIKFSLKPGS